VTGARGMERPELERRKRDLLEQMDLFAAQEATVAVKALELDRARADLEQRRALLAGMLSELCAYAAS
jgi:hypothetical protein